MPFDVGASVGNASGWLNGFTTPTAPVTDLSPHVDGGPVHANVGSNVNADTSVLHIAAGIVIVALVLLWVLGALVIKTANL